MKFTLGVDLGTTFTTVAVADERGAWPVTLGHQATAVPSVAFVDLDGRLLVGEPAEAGGRSHPERVAREFKRRLGDTVPLLLGGSAYSPQVLLAELLREVVAIASRERGGSPDHVVVTHPANWGGYKRELLTNIVQLAGLSMPTSFLSEPEAAAAWYATQERLAEGTAVAVYDLGGGTFDAAVLEHRDHRFAVVGQPLGIEHLGGIDFDHALLLDVTSRSGLPGEALAQASLAWPAEAERQREAVISAKIQLSSRAEVDVPIFLPRPGDPVRVTRAQFERLIGSALDQTVAMLGQAVRSAGRSPDQLASVLLVGGSSRIPAVAERIAAAMGRPVAVDAHPKNAVALGAAMTAWALATGVTSPSEPAVLVAETENTTPDVAGVAAFAPANRRAKSLRNAGLALVGVLGVGALAWSQLQTDAAPERIEAKLDGWVVADDTPWTSSSFGTASQIGPSQTLVPGGDGRSLPVFQGDEVRPLIFLGWSKRWVENGFDPAKALASFADQDLQPARFNCSQEAEPASTSTSVQLTPSAELSWACPATTVENPKPAHRWMLWAQRRQGGMLFVVANVIDDSHVAAFRSAVALARLS